MNRIEKLIAELCPDGVEWKKLGEVCEFQNGFAFKSNLFKDSGLPIIRITNINGKNVDLNDLKYFEPSDYKEDLEKFKINKGDILIAMSGATTGKIGYYDFDDIAYLNQRVGKFSPKKEILNNRFLYHFLNLNYQKIFSLSGGGAQPNLSSIQLMEKISIPIPPLPIQEEIVKILDTFTELEAELELKLQAELEARKKQYEYYRNTLLTPVEHNGRWFLNGKEVEWKKLGEVIKLNYGKSLKESERDGGKYPVLGSNGRIGFHSSFLVEGPCIIIGRKGSAGAVVWEESNCYPIDTTYFVELKNNDIILKYLFYKLVNLKISSDKQEGGVPGINRELIYNIPIPIPPLSEQDRIVAILDKFDALVNDISQGLPAEIEARRKQYEYYRNKLLTFKRKE
jgi:type I restriction enzyme S subunit